MNRQMKNPLGTNLANRSPYFVTVFELYLVQVNIRPDGLDAPGRVGRPDKQMDLVPVH